MPDVGLVFSQRYLQHNTNPHRLPVSKQPYPFVEQVDHPSNHRLVQRTMHLINLTGLGEHLQMLEPRPAELHELTRYHTPEYVEHVRAFCEAGGGDAGQGSPVGVDSYEVALLAAGGVIGAVDALLDGTVRTPYALVRPPGHHAVSDLAMGFCVFSNVALAAMHAREERGIERILIYDWDVHHGNGTQDAFYADPNTLFISTHQNELYPAGMGTLEQVGEGDAAGRTVNIPLPPGSGDAAYRAAMDEIIIPIAREFRPDLIFVSAGQDASAHDALGRMCLTCEGYRDLTEAMLSLANELCGGRLVVAQEGGYSDLYGPYCTFAIIEALAGVRTGVEEPMLQSRADAWPQSQSVGLDARAALDACKQVYRQYWSSLV